MVSLTRIVATVLNTMLFSKIVQAAGFTQINELVHAGNPLFQTPEECVKYVIDSTCGVEIMVKNTTEINFLGSLNSFNTSDNTTTCYQNNVLIEEALRECYTPWNLTGYDYTKLNGQVGLDNSNAQLVERFNFISQDDIIAYAASWSVKLRQGMNYAVASAGAAINHIEAHGQLTGNIIAIAGVGVAIKSLANGDDKFVKCYQKCGDWTDSNGNILHYCVELQNRKEGGNCGFNNVGGVYSTLDAAYSHIGEYLNEVGVCAKVYDAGDTRMYTKFVKKNGGETIGDITCP